MNKFSFALYTAYHHHRNFVEPNWLWFTKKRLLLLPIRWFRTIPVFSDAVHSTATAAAGLDDDLMPFFPLSFYVRIRRAFNFCSSWFICIKERTRLTEHTSKRFESREWEFLNGQNLVWMVMGQQWWRRRRRQRRLKERKKELKTSLKSKTKRSPRMHRIETLAMRVFLPNHNHILNTHACSV